MKTLRTFVEGLEVWNNQYWEWEDAILDGADAYFHLRKEQQGTITVDMETRKLSFAPDVLIDLKGAVAGLGRGRLAREKTEPAVADVLSKEELAHCGNDPDRILRSATAKRAIFDALGLLEEGRPQWTELKLRLQDRGRVCAKATGSVRDRMWDLGAITFRLAFSTSDEFVDCTAIAIADLG